METGRDKLRAVAYALGLHALLIGLLFVGLLMPRSTALADAAGPPIEAALVSAPQQATSLAHEIRALERKTSPEPAPQPRAEPQPQQSPQPPQPIPQARLPKPDTVDQQEVRRDDLAAVRQQRQEQEERHKQAQIDLSRQQEQQQEEIRQRQLAEIRKQRSDAARTILLAEQRLKQLQDQAALVARNNAPAPATPVPPRPQSGTNGASASQNAKYIQAIHDVLDQNWRNNDVPEGVHCHVQFTQARPTGEITHVVFGDCPFDADARATVEALKGVRLPYAGYENLFQPEVNIEMCYPEDACK